MSELHRLIGSRVTVHAYTTTPIPEEAIERALAAAVTAPNHRLTEPWRFLRIGPATRRALAEVAVQLKIERLDRPTNEQIERARAAVSSKILDPPELIVAVQHLHEDPLVTREDYAAVACAIQNLMLSLHADGIGSKWSTGAVTRAARTYRLLGLDPAHERIVGFVWAGKPRERCAKPRRRRSLDEVVRRLP